jgi:single-stranded-DNA-specific exonuclease
MSDPAFLGVQSSATGRCWVRRAHDENLALTLTQRHNIPDLLAVAMAGRGVTLDGAEAYLTPRLKDQLPNPSDLRDMDKATARFQTALAAGEKIAIWGDYDVDGATSSALLIRFCRTLGIDPVLYVPDRMTEGYGPNEAGLRSLAQDGVRLVITVDCGTTAHAPLQAAKEAGLDVIVIDHHAAEPSLPPCVALVNPNRLDEASPHTYLAAVGVTFLFVIAATRALRAAGFFTADRPEPDLMQWLDMVAVGTVCDVVPLLGLNRALVAQGLKILRARGNLGLAALADIAGLDRAPDTFAAGFMLGPRINAGGRVGKSDLGARLLSTRSPQEAADLARQLDALNTERRAIETAVQEDALANLPDTPALLVTAAGDGWHPGVIGIVASRLKDRFHRPAIVIALDGEIGKGSGRSVRGLDLGAAIIAARQAGILQAGGGHKMAAGFTVARDQIPALQAFLEDRFHDQLEGAPLQPTLTIDGLLAARAVTVDMAETLQRLAPYGTSNPEPRFVIPDCRLTKVEVLKEKHIRCLIRTSGDGPWLQGIAFNVMDTPLGDALLNTATPWHLAVRLSVNRWQGRETIQVQIEDAGSVITA